ncbi:MAG: hypothetical protein PHI34_06480 [Acidobacteriota bacterium]|nr:hypothetical protein [Acidobacteriota bacterium]
MIRPRIRSTLGGRWIGASVSAAVFVQALWLAGYVGFPRRSFLFKGDDRAATRREAVFVWPDGRSDNVWTADLNLTEIGLPGNPIELEINGRIAARISAPRRSNRIEFRSGALRPGRNVLAVVSSSAFLMGRLRIRNVTGYSSGFPEIVAFPRANVYPGAVLWRASAVRIAASVILGAVLVWLGSRPRKRRATVMGRLTGALRWPVAALPLAISLAPAVTPYRVLVSAGSLFGWVLLFAVLDRWPEFASFLGRPALWIRKQEKEALRRLSRRASGVPWLRTRMDQAGLALLAVSLVLILAAPGGRRMWGDGQEYFTMMIGIARQGTTAITVRSCNEVDRILGRNPHEPELPLFDWFRKSTPSLVWNDATIDGPHFWAYSCLAAAFDPLLRLVHAPPLSPFRVLHAVLLLAGFWILRRALGPPGGLALGLIVLFSPLLWFVDKVQIEFFTAILAIVGTGLLGAKRPAGAALAFALASTQNPPFAVLAVLALGLGFYRRGWAFVRRFWPIWLACGALALLAPAYYYLRYGVLNPISATGQASLGRDPLLAKKMLSLLIDPDIGLFPNWPLGLLLAGWALVHAVRRRKQADPSGILPFAILSIPFLLWIQSSTGNMNHGATVHITRYAVWYLGFFFLAAARLLSGLRRRPSARAAAGLGLAGVLGLVSVVTFPPSRPEIYVAPTAFSTRLYADEPSLYNPLPEIFFERMRGEEGAPPKRVWAVSNPSGSKILIIRNRIFDIPSYNGVPGIETCPDLDPAAVYQEAKSLLRSHPHRDYFYINGQGSRLKKTAPGSNSPKPPSRRG